MLTFSSIWARSCSLMNDEVYNHYLLWVYLISRVWCGGIDTIEVDFLRNLVDVYLTDHKRLYPLRNQTSNLHSLNHLIDTFLFLGLLKENNGFPFEAINGQCVSMLTGPRFLIEQIASRTKVNLMIGIKGDSEPDETEFKLPRPFSRRNRSKYIHL